MKNVTQRSLYVKSSKLRMNFHNSMNFPQKILSPFFLNYISDKKKRMQLFQNQNDIYRKRLQHLLFTYGSIPTFLPLGFQSKSNLGQAGLQNICKKWQEKFPSSTRGCNLCKHNCCYLVYGELNHSYASASFMSYVKYWYNDQQHQSWICYISHIQ